MNKKLTEEDFFKYLKYLPISVIHDVEKRISDWLSCDGSKEDDYIQQQYRYARRVAIKNGYKE